MASSIEYETILKDMLSTVPDTVDKREGSIIYNTLAPVAFQIAEQNYMLSYIFNLMFADTAEGEWLDRVTSDFGVDREQATKAIRQINTTNSEGLAVDVPLSSRFAVNDITLCVTEKIDTGQFKAECELVGSVGNQYGGAILPVDNINGLGAAELVQAPLIPARDIETDEALRTRFYLSVRQVNYGGNIADYEKRTIAIDGVGAVKVFTAVSQGAGHVGLVIGDELGNSATQVLIDEVQALFGVNGNGIAPIGHTVTVKTSANLVVDVVAPVKLKAGVSIEVVGPVVTQAITDYIISVEFADATVYFAKMVAAILNCHESIVDVGIVTINGASQNLSLIKTFEAYQVPTVGTITISEVV